MTHEFGTACFAVPRHRFIPPHAWAVPMAPGRQACWIDRRSSPDRWWEAVHTDTVIVTQIDDGETELTPETVARTHNYTCSSSAPSLVFGFLGLLGVRPRDRILEIGTGTGWTAGLLSHLAGDEYVTSVEIDEKLSAVAADNLDRSGRSPFLVTGDGSGELPSDASFDRVHVTCGVLDIPYTWVRHSRPGGVIVLPWMGSANMLRLDVHEDGTAHGRFSGHCGYMMLRGQRRRPLRAVPDDERERDVASDPREILCDSPGWRVVLGGVIGETPLASERGEGRFRGSMSSGESFARVRVEDGRKWVMQRGPRNLWDEAEAAYRRWSEWGFPEIDRLGMTVTPDGQYVWVDHPGNRVV